MRLKSFLIILLVALLLLSGGTVALASEAEQRSDFVTPVFIVNTSFLNIRTGPGAQYTVLITVTGGTELPVLGVANDLVWYQVSTVAGIGWVNSEFTLARGDFTNVPLVEGDDIFGSVGVNIRPGDEVADEVASTTTTTTTSTSSDDAFGQAAFTGGREWGISIREAHPARSGAGIANSTVTTANADLNTIVAIDAAASADGILWYQVDIFGGDNVWVEGPKTLARPFACGDEFTVVIMNKDIAPRKGPDGSGSLTGNRVIPVGSEAYLVDARDGDYKIELQDGSTGWVPSVDTTIRSNARLTRNYCNSATRSTVRAANNTTTTTTTETVTRADVGPRVSTPTAIINTAFLNIRSGPGAQYSVVATLSGGTEVDLLGIAPDNVWYLIGGNFGVGWLNSEFILIRGQGNLPVIRQFSGATLSRPFVEVTNAVNLYAAPDVTLGVVGAVSGPVEFDIVARSSDGLWVQISTTIGFGWVQVAQVAVQGDLSLVPTINN